MSAPNLVVTGEEHARFLAELEAIGREANAKLVFLIDRAGQQIAGCGELAGVDPTALASLTAGNVAATEGVAALVGESEFTSLYHEGRQESLHVSVVGKRLILLIVFDARSSLGLVRLRADQHRPILEKHLEALLTRKADEPASQEIDDVFSSITEADIDALFG